MEHGTRKPDADGRTRVAHLSSAHPWQDTRVFGRFCRTLARNGYDVTLVANGVDGPDSEDGVRLVLDPQTGGRVRRLLLGIPRVLARGWRVDARIYHLHDPELMPLIPILRLRGAQVLYDAHEDLPSQVLDKHYLPRGVRPLLGLVARGICAAIDRTAHHVLVATPTIAERFRRAPVTIVHNYPELVEEVDAGTPYDEREHVIAYVGGITSDRGAEEMIDALELLDLPDDWRMRLVGPYSPGSLRDALATRPGWSRVDDYGRVSPDRARELRATARMGLIVCPATPAHVDSLPTKLFEYMAAGLPVIASDFPLWRSIVDEAGCGLLVEPTARGMADAIMELARDPERARAMGERGRAAARERLNWHREEEKLLGVYEMLRSADRAVTTG